MASLGWVGCRIKYVPHLQVNTSPFMCFLARRDNWGIAMAIDDDIYNEANEENAEWHNCQSLPERFENEA